MINYRTTLPFERLYLSLFSLTPAFCRALWSHSLSFPPLLSPLYLGPFFVFLIIPFTCRHHKQPSLFHVLHSLLISFLPFLIPMPVSLHLSPSCALLLAASYFHLCPSSTISFCITHGEVWEKHPCEWPIISVYLWSPHMGSGRQVDS